MSFLSAVLPPDCSNQSEGRTGFCTSYLYGRWSGGRGGSGLINCVVQLWRLTLSEQSKLTFYGTFLSSGLIWAISMVMLSVFHTQEWLVKYSKTIMDLCRRVIVFIILRWTSGKCKIKRQRNEARGWRKADGRMWEEAENDNRGDGPSRSKRPKKVVGQRMCEWRDGRVLVL